MDTGAYMENKMDDLITSGLQLHEEMFDDIYLEIQKYISERGFIFTADYVIEKFRAKRTGEYVPWSVNQIIQKFYDRLHVIIR